MKAFLAVTKFFNELGCSLFIFLGLFYLLTKATPGSTFATVRSAVGWTAVVGILVCIVAEAVSGAAKVARKEE